jgi:hypothetical protein
MRQAGIVEAAHGLLVDRAHLVQRLHRFANGGHCVTSIFSSSYLISTKSPFLTSSSTCFSVKPEHVARRIRDAVLLDAYVELKKARWLTPQLLSKQLIHFGVAGGKRNATRGCPRVKQRSNRLG